jgi:membrane-bound lytic murein transglycosylase A
MTLSNRIGWVLLLPALGALLGACNYTTPAASQAASATTLTDVASNTSSTTPEEKAELAKLAKTPRKLSKKVFIPEGPEGLPFIDINPLMQQALYEQVNYLRRPDAKRADMRGLNRLEMIEAVERLRGKSSMAPEELAANFDFYRVNTDLKEDQVRVTGYYTPAVKASHTRSSKYQYPLYRKPDGNMPSPNAIWEGALDGQGLEIAWLASRRAVEDAQLQGSVLVEFPDGKREYLGYGGAVKGSGGAYVFFTKVDNTVLGAGTFPLTAGYSIAVDTRYIPIGATILAELPDLDPAGRLKGYTYRILFAQDKGGAIKTTKRIDLYCGIGKPALKEAHKINGHGRMWLMMPRHAGATAMQ